jgi:glutamine amidotransferase
MSSAEMTMITIVDYDAGNVGSVINICKKAGGNAEVSRDPSDIAKAQKLVLPGVGHFGRAMERLQKTGLVDALNEAVLDRRVPMLGICLGMQLLMQSSEESDSEGFGWIPGKVVRFKPEAESRLRVPHMGWNDADVVRDDPLLTNLPPDPRFYFVHSFYVVCDRDEDVLMKTNYGTRFVSASRRDNIWGTQFHPEKSHKFGLAVIRNFVGRIAPC